MKIGEYKIRHIKQPTRIDYDDIPKPIVLSLIVQLALNRFIAMFIGFDLLSTGTIILATLIVQTTYYCKKAHKCNIEKKADYFVRWYKIAEVTTLSEVVDRVQSSLAINDQIKVKAELLEEPVLASLIKVKFKGLIATLAREGLIQPDQLLLHRMRSEFYSTAKQLEDFGIVPVNIISCGEGLV